MTVMHMRAEACVEFLSKDSHYTPCPEKNGPPKQNAVTCTIYNTIQ